MFSNTKVLDRILSLLRDLNQISIMVLNVKKLHLIFIKGHQFRTPHSSLTLCGLNLEASTSYN